MEKWIYKNQKVVGNEGERCVKDELMRNRKTDQKEIGGISLIKKIALS